MPLQKCMETEMKHHINIGTFSLKTPKWNTLSIEGFTLLSISPVSRRQTATLSFCQKVPMNLYRNQHFIAYTPWKVTTTAYRQSGITYPMSLFYKLFNMFMNHDFY